MPLTPEQEWIIAACGLIAPHISSSFNAAVNARASPDNARHAPYRPASPTPPRVTSSSWNRFCVANAV